MQERAMPFFSYLAIPEPGAGQELCAALAATPHCEIIPADEDNIVILVTDAPDEEAEKSLQAELKKIKALQALFMTFGHADEDQTVSQRESA
jgi:nitrate reductase NapAB chaperone NapD